MLLLQLSDATYLNLDTVTVLHVEGDTVRVFFQDPTHGLALTVEEAAVLVHYLYTHAEHDSYQAVRRL